MDARSLQHVRLDQHIVACDVRVILRDVSDATHVGGQVVHLVHAAGGDQAILEAPKVEHLELLARGRRVLGPLDVGPAHVVPPVDQVSHQVVTDEPSRTGDQRALSHCIPLRPKVEPAVQ